MKPLFENEQTLLEELRKGNEKALNYIFEMWYPLLCYFAAKNYVEKWEAEDAVIVVFEKFWYGKKSFASIKKLKYWFYVSTRNACLNIIDKKKNEKTNLKKLLRRLLPQNKKLPASVVECELLNEIRLTGLNKLPPQLRKTFELMLKGFKNAEISQIMGLPIDVVANNKYHARIILRDYLNNICKD